MHCCCEVLQLSSTLRRNTTSLIGALAVAAFCVACVPTHNVKPLPNFVEVAIEPGDTVVVTTTSGETFEFVVTEVGDKTSHSADRQIALSDIAELKKVAWKRPPSPCGGEKPLGCSVPLLVSLASDEHSHYQETFYDACAQHDYCYRHGYRTYGLVREYCDAEFQQNLLNTCPEASSTKVGKFFEIFDDNVDARSNCLRIANDFYSAARDFGEKHFQTESSSYCEYDGPQLPEQPRA